jgi:hypothetical protein
VEILLAGHVGAIETLFVAPGAKMPGRFSPETATVRYDDTPQPDSEDLVNLAAILVLRTGGSVEMALSGNVPGGSQMAAVLRYSFIPTITTPATRLNGMMSAI